MNIIVALKQTVDLVEELELSDDGTDIERGYVAFKLNEWDEQALEEALALKDADGATVTVVALDEPDADQTLYTALAKGADRAVKLTGEFAARISSRRLAAILADYLAAVPYDLILMGVQTPEDLDGPPAATLAAVLGLPHVAVAVGIAPAGDGVIVSQELGGGVVHTLQLSGPAVVGVQAARQAPRYIPIARVRAAMGQGAIVEAPAAAAGDEPVLRVRRMFVSESGSHAEMLSGDADAVAARIVEIIRERGALR